MNHLSHICQINPYFGCKSLFLPLTILKYEAWSLIDIRGKKKVIYLNTAFRPLAYLYSQIGKHIRTSRVPNLWECVFVVSASEFCLAGRVAPYNGANARILPHGNANGRIASRSLGGRGGAIHGRPVTCAGGEGGREEERLSDMLLPYRRTALIVARTM